MTRTIWPRSIVGLAILGFCFSAAADLLVTRPGNLSALTVATVDETGGTPKRDLISFVSAESIDGGTFGPDGDFYLPTTTFGFGSVHLFDGRTGEFLAQFVPYSSGFLTATTAAKFDAKGCLYVSGRIYHSANSTFGPGRIVRFDGTTRARLAEFGTNVLRQPVDLVFGPDQRLYVADSGVGIVRFDPATGRLLDTVVADGAGGLGGATGLAFGPDGNLYVGSSSNNAVLRFETTAAISPATFPPMGQFVPSGSGGLSQPDGLVFGPDGRLYVCSRGTRSVLRYAGTNGAFIDTFVAPAGTTNEVPVSLVFTPRPPRLDIQPAGASLHLVWPVFTKRFQLQSAQALSATPDWMSNRTPAVVTGTNLGVTLPASSTNRFFRLKAD